MTTLQAETSGASNAGPCAPGILNHEIMQRLRCPATGQPLLATGGELRSADGRERYPIAGGIPDLRRSPVRMRIDRPWYEPWDDLKSMTFDFPEPLHSTDLPFHLDAYQARIAGAHGDGRWLLEIGCAERHAQAYFVKRGFNYVGTDYDTRGRGPHLLADGHNLPFADTSFDVVYSMAVFEHLISPVTAAQEAFRVLRPGGIIFGSAAFVYGFHDVASFHHMTHAGLLCVLRTAGFEHVRVWPGWPHWKAIPGWLYRGGSGAPWRALTGAAMALSDWTFTRTSNLIRRAIGKRPLDLLERRTHIAGGLNFAASRPAAPAQA